MKDNTIKNYKICLQLDNSKYSIFLILSCIAWWKYWHLLQILSNQLKMVFFSPFFTCNHGKLVPIATFVLLLYSYIYLPKCIKNVLLKKQVNLHGHQELHRIRMVLELEFSVMRIKCTLKSYVQTKSLYVILTIHTCIYVTYL